MLGFGFGNDLVECIIGVEIEIEPGYGILDKTAGGCEFFFSGFFGPQGSFLVLAWFFNVKGNPELGPGGLAKRDKNQDEKNGSYNAHFRPNLNS